MKLLDILKDTEYKVVSKDTNLDREIVDICYDSRKIKDDTMFVAIHGKTLDGHKYIKNAYENGSRVFVVEKDDVEMPKDSLVIKVKNARVFLSKASCNFFENPSEKLKIIGITGTKGKTTTSNYIKTILETAGKSTGIIGTNGIFYNDKEEIAYNTTPESYELHRVFNNMINDGVEYVVMEVSSLGLLMHRVDDVDFDLGLFTNISHDHIGPKEHATFEDYLECKIKLFNLCKVGIINIDDQESSKILEKGTCDFLTYSIDTTSDFQAINLVNEKSLDHLGVSFEIKDKDLSYFVSSPGKFSVYNSLAAISTCKYLGIEDKYIKKSLEDIHVSGRVEIIKGIKKGTVILDYAHNESSLNNVLDTLRQYNPNRLICLIGSVGGRGVSRRYEIGEVISKKCDVCILTSDNPDYEDPQLIIEDILKGFKKRTKYIIQTDRKEAIKEAFEMLEDGDILLLAGKGHEEYQIISGKREEHSDKEVILSLLDK